MKECRINIQNDIVEKILEALKTCSQGIGVTLQYEYTIEKDRYGSTIIFIPKEGRKMNPTDFFFLGYFVGRDY
ncbi:MAG: hypothetical protein KBA33_08320 [Cloacibacterium sp.]|nr:hypothetical protein [Cloacibacterium sp.]